MTETKHVLITLFILFLIIGITYIYFFDKEEVNNYEPSSPEEVVKQYFTSWNDMNYPEMYSAFSDGFKKIEPTANDLRAFTEYVKSQHIDKVIVKKIEEKSNDGRTAIVDYAVEFVLKNKSKTSFDGTFTLKYKQGDIIPGWKLIHPYGENIDL